MPDDRTVLYTLLGVLFILLAVVVYNNQRFRKEQEKGGRPIPEGSDEEEGDSDDLLLKFVRHEGSIVGETVATHGNRLILKQAGVFKSVPLALATVEGDEVVLEGEIDWVDAIGKGEAWHAAHTKGQDPLVTEHLTRSQDVRKPALAALKDAEEE